MLIQILFWGFIFFSGYAFGRCKALEEERVCARPYGQAHAPKRSCRSIQEVIEGMYPELKYLRKK